MRGRQFICVTWVIHTCDMTHSHVWHDSFTCVTWLMHTCDTTDFTFDITAMAHIWMSHMNESWHTYKWVMSHIWMSHVAHIRHYCHGTHMNESYEWVMSHIWMSHVAHIRHYCSTLLFDITASFVWHEVICVVWLFHMGMSCMTWLIHICDVAHFTSDMTGLFVWHARCGMTLSHVIYLCDMIQFTLDITNLFVSHARSYVWYDSFTWELDVWHGSFIFVTGLIHMCDMAHSYL